MKTGVLITNLGTPDAPTAKAIRRYLREFLWDSRVVDTPRFIWFFILQIILAIRPAKVAGGYRAVWTEQGSPLLKISLEQKTALQAQLGDTTPVALGMRYGNPSIASALDELVAQGVEKITVLPLYPQYSATTTASTFDAIASWSLQQRKLPAINFISDYHADPRWVKAVANSVRSQWQNQPRGEKLLMSFHGIPQRYCELGDPYFRQCETGAQLIAKELGLKPEEWTLTFQSRVGREPWLQPYTDKTLIEWGQQGLKSVDVICPGFSADCLETLEEIQVENAENFINAGGQYLRYIPCLNSSPEHIQMIAEIVRE